MSVKLTTRDFITKARSRHGARYDYSRAVYANNNTKVEIVCRKHGSFWQRPVDHIRAQGCPQCGVESKRMTREDFITKAQSCHGDRYDYSRAVYINIQTNVEIVCRKHGSFWQRPDTHICNHGCHQCGVESNKDKHRMTREEFIRRAIIRHVDEVYDYSRVVYTNCNTKVEIVCPEHGSFWQTPAAHLGKPRILPSRCPKCANASRPVVLARGNLMKKWLLGMERLKNGSPWAEFLAEVEAAKKAQGK